jgi:rubrerythrin
MSISLFHVALELEREGFKLFNELAHQTKEESGWKMFLALAHQERDHIAALEKEIERRKGRGGEPPPDIQSQVAEYRGRLLAVLEEVKRKSRAAVVSHTDQVRALEVAERMEEFICSFYAEAISRTESQQSKEFFLQMLEMERGHRDLLEGSIAYLEEPERVQADRSRQTGDA